MKLIISFTFVSLLFLSACNSKIDNETKLAGKIEILMKKCNETKPDSVFTFIPQEDILSYNWKTHIISLTENGTRKLPKHPIWHNTKFVLTINNKEIYTGGFVNPLSGLSFESVNISLPYFEIKSKDPTSNNRLQIDSTLADNQIKIIWNNSKKDLRSNKKVYDVLKRNNLLR
ncbi:MAG: hypothetical protein ACEPO8_01425 [Rhodothermaceae bacterium]